MEAVSKLGRSMFLLAAILFGIGGVTGWHYGSKFEALVFALLAVLIAFLGFLLEPEERKERNYAQSADDDPIRLSRWKP